MRCLRTLVMVATALALTACAGGSPAPPADPPPTRYRVVALGDSVTSGAACRCVPFPEQYAAALRQNGGATVAVQNLGVGGLDSQTLRRQLEDRESPQSQAVATADIDVVTIGANDFADQHTAVTRGSCAADGDLDCAADELEQLQQNLTAILDHIRSVRQGRATAVLVTGYWNVFEDGAVARTAFPAAGRAATQKLTTTVNVVIEKTAANSRARYVDLTEPFESNPPGHDVTNLLAADGNHPNAAGHALIARQLLSAGLPGLR